MPFKYEVMYVFLASQLTIVSLDVLFKFWPYLISKIEKMYIHSGTSIVRCTKTLNGLLGEMPKR